MTGNNLIFPDNYNIIQNTIYNRVTMLLKDQYADLYEDIVDDGYKIEIFDFDYFKEIIRDGETVGFISLKYLDKYELSIHECYIKRDYRGNNLMFDELMKLSSIPNIKLYARKPNYAFTKILEKNKAGMYLTDDLFIAAIKMVVDSDDIYTDLTIDDYYHLENIQNFSTYYLYDLKDKICYFDEEWNGISYFDVIGIVNPRKSDLKKYDYSFLNNTNNLNTEEISDIAQNNWDDIDDSWVIWDNLIHEYNDVNRIIGTSNELTDEMKTILAENDLPEEIGFKIRNHIITADQDAHIKSRYKLFRRDYLIANPDKINRRSADEIIEDEDGKKCPVCDNSIINFGNCIYCGFDFDNLDYIYRLLENIENPRKHILDWKIKYGSEEYPSGYDVLDCYHILSYIKEKASSFNDVIDAIELNTDDPVNLYFKKNISTLIETVDGVDLTQYLNKLNNDDLTTLLSSNNISCHGKKKKLVKLILKNNLIPYNYTGKCRLSKEGEKFLDEMNWIGIYDKYLSKFEFDDFYNNIDHNDDLYNQILVLLDKYLDKSFEMLPVDDCYEAISDIYYQINDYESCLIQSLKRFILRLNPSHSYQAFYMEYDVFDEHNIWLIKESLSKLDINIEEFFNKIWDEFKLNNYYSTKDVAVTYLNKTLDDLDLKELSDEYYDKYLY